MKLKEPKIIGIRFTAKEIKKADVTRFRNLIIKLGVKFRQLEFGKLKGHTVDLVICDEAEEMSKEEYKKIFGERK